MAYWSNINWKFSEIFLTWVELILQKQQAQLKEMLDSASKMHKTREQTHEMTLKELGLRTQQDNNIVEQLKAIAAEKEAKVKALEEEINQMKQAVSVLNLDVAFSFT